ncbi:hypothetical protein JXA32_08455 [Candidatus Sumerlaeota bacterium]|nr:hypothetical protein [Candidatus Sumerlaeota bacterium]
MSLRGEARRAAAKSSARQREKPHAARVSHRRRKIPTRRYGRSTRPHRVKPLEIATQSSYAARRVKQLEPRGIGTQRLPRGFGTLRDASHAMPSGCAPASQTCLMSKQTFPLRHTRRGVLLFFRLTGASPLLP